MQQIPFQVVRWQEVGRVAYPGVTGQAWSQPLSFDGLRVRLVEYSPGYLADHWCQKGHVVYCLEGSFTAELETGERFVLEQGMSYIVSDGASSHRSSTETGVRLLIIDGDFLK
jgi:quercetin dioxygenase-like cupin family protein